MTVSFHTLGCKLNFAETSTISRLFTENGYNKIEFGQTADVVVINTCTVTAQADKKCRQAITKAIKTSPDAVIVIVGCFAELKANEIEEIPGVDLVLGTNEKFNIIAHIEELNQKERKKNNEDVQHAFFHSFSLHDRTRSFVKVQDGCDYNCAYCTVHKARGKSRNAPISEIVTNVQTIANKGIKEIVLTGVNIGDFGKSTGETFLQLLGELDAIAGIERIRIGSVEPNLISEELIKFIANSSLIAPHFHIPLQSGSNKILELMKRRYTNEQFAEKLNLIQRYISHAAIGIDVIVGFPGETNEFFNETFNFIEKLNIAYIHVFKYSERPGTQSINLPDKVKPTDILQRSKKLIKLSETKKKLFKTQNTGRICKVIFEQKTKKGAMTGFTDNYIKVEAPYNPAIIGKSTSFEI